MVLAADTGLASYDERPQLDAVGWDRLLSRLAEPGVRDVVGAAEAAVLAGELTPDQAATRILAALG